MIRPWISLDSFSKDENVDCAIESFRLVNIKSTNKFESDEDGPISSITSIIVIFQGFTAYFSFARKCLLFTVVFNPSNYLLDDVD